MLIKECVFYFIFLSFKNLHVGCEKGNPLKNIQCGLGPGSQTCPKGYYCNSNRNNAVCCQIRKCFKAKI